MEASMFKGLPELLPGKYTFTELHVLLCDPPRPVAVRVKHSYRLLPSNIWGVAEFVARTSQDLDVDQMPACVIFKFLTQLLAKVIDSSCVLKQTSELQGEGLLSLLLTKKVQEKANLLAITDITLAITDGATHTEDRGKGKIKAGKGNKKSPQTLQLVALD
jgi:hypothetical protein